MNTNNNGDRELTAQQQAFVLHFTSTSGAIGNGAEAARRAGYSQKNANELARQLLGKPHVRNAVFEANRAAISGELATKAVALLGRVIEDETVAMKTRVEAAKTVLDRAGFVAAVVTAENPLDKPLTEMSRSELETIVHRGVDILRMADELSKQPAQLN